MEAAGMCTCNIIETTYLREASAEDEAACAWPHRGSLPANPQETTDGE
jgi:hypothetical protein